MKKNVLLTLVIALIATSCSNTKKEVILKHANGKAKLVYETMMVDDEKQLISEEMFYETGTTKYKQTYKDNKPFGTWQYYYETGKLFAEADFSNSAIGENWIFYHKDGERIFGKNDEITILEISKNERCPITVEGGNDIVQKQCQFYDNFDLRSIGNVKGNKRDGVWTFYFENGNKQAEGGFINDIQHGEHTIYHENGNIYYKGSYENGKRIGVWTFYNEKGQEVGSKNFDDNTTNQ